MNWNCSAHGKRKRTPRTSTAAIFLMLVILLVIEAHQDRILNELAARENREQEEIGRCVQIFSGFTAITLIFRS